jgi:hypothetical protein
MLAANHFFLRHRLGTVQFHVPIALAQRIGNRCLHLATADNLQTFLLNHVVTGWWPMQSEPLLTKESVCRRWIQLP